MGTVSGGLGICVEGREECRVLSIELTGSNVHFKGLDCGCHVEKGLQKGKNRHQRISTSG